MIDGRAHASPPPPSPAGGTSVVPETSATETSVTGTSRGAVPSDTSAVASVAGRGFTVVAQEVKALSAQTARATQEIAERLLKRNAYALAYNKRVLNKQVLAQFNQVHDAALGYEFLNFYMQTPQAKALAQGRGEDKL